MSSRATSEQDADPGRGPGRHERDARPAPVPSARARWSAALHRHRTDLAVCLFFLLFAGWVTNGLWPLPSTRVLALNPADQALYEWFLAVDSRALFGEFGLLTERLNAPDGVNLMANTSVIALGVLFAPVSLLFGTPTTFALLALLNLAGTAIAWYLLFARLLGASRLAAALGAGLCGFGPGMVSQTNSHLHMTAQWLVPVIVWLVVRMLRAADPALRPGGAGPDWRRLVTSAVWLAVVVTVQVFVGEEVLFLAAVTLLVMAIAYAGADRRLAARALPGFVAGMALATGLALVVLAYPLWFQFAGPQSVADGMFSPHYFSADLASWWTPSPLALGGDDSAARLTTGPAEYNAFLGWPLILVALLATGWLVRRPLVFAVGAAALVMGGLSLGPDVIVDGDRTTVPGPYTLLLGVPVVDGALPMRFALAVLPLIATVLVLAIDQAARIARDQSRQLGWLGQRLHLLVTGAVVVALLPIFPTPLPTAERPPVPEFIAGGHWRECVAPGGVLVPVPLPTPTEPWPMRWAAHADAAFALPEGFFIASYGKDGTAAMGTYKQPTSALLAEVARRGNVPVIGPDERTQAARDVEFWGASCVVLAAGTAHEQSLRRTLEQLYGAPTRIADAWIWRV